MVRGKGLEPSRIASHAPQACVSTIPPPPHILQKPHGGETFIVFYSMVPSVRFELTTQGFSIPCSTPELTRPVCALSLVPAYYIKF